MKNNKGFSLVELLIVIAIMGVLAVLAFNVFGNVLSNSKRKADDQQAANIAKAVQTYCLDTDDWSLTNISAPTTASDAIAALTEKITVGTIDYGPYVALKDTAADATSDTNAAALAPQYTDNTGWSITIDEVSQTVTCKPGTDDKVEYGTTTTPVVTP